MLRFPKSLKTAAAFLSVLPESPLPRALGLRVQCSGPTDVMHLIKDRRYEELNNFLKRIHTPGHFLDEEKLRRDLKREVGPGVTNPHLNGLLLNGALDGFLEVVRLALRLGVDINVPAQTGRWTALHAAAANGFNRVVKELLFAGANIFALESEGSTPLVAAADRGYCKVVNALLDGCTGQGRNLTEYLEMKNHQGFTALAAAASNGHLKVAQLLLKAGANVHAQNEDGNTALILASGFGHAEVVQTLLQSQTGSALRILKLLETKNKDNSTALITAASRGYSEVVQALLRAGTAGDLVHDAQNQNERRALRLACKSGHTQVVRLLLEHARPEESDRRALAEASYGSGDPALIIAAREGHHKIVQMLLNAGADVEAPGFGPKATALMWAARQGHMNVVQTLLAGGANVNATDRHGETALQLAAKQGHHEVAVLLVAACAK